MTKLKLKTENGILSFSSKDFLGRTVESLKEMDNQEKEVKLYEFYDKGFMPLYPHFREDDNIKLQKFSEKKKNKIQKLMSLNPQARIQTEIDEDGELVGEFDDDLITDDEFASILNDKREIIVDNVLYRYTYSGMFSVNDNEKQVLDNYIIENNIEDLIPDPNTLTRGESNPANKITLSIPTEQEILYAGCNNQQFYGDNYVGLEFLDNCGSGGSGSGSGSGSSSTVDHTRSLINLIDDLDACNTLNGFLNSGFGLLGVSRKCYANFDSKYRTKTKYWKENYFIWNSIGVKVKHQKKGWTGLWRAKSTDEVSLSVSQATFKYNISIPNFPQTYAPLKMYFFEDKIFNSQAQILSYTNAIYKPPKPDIPFVNDVIMVEYVNHVIGTQLSVEKMRNLFYSGAWQGAKLIVNEYKKRDPKNVTHILYTPTEVYVNYVNLENRKLNTSKIVNRLDYNFGLGIKFNLDVDSNGRYSINLGLGSVTIPKLYDYSKVKMDFVGATRKGNTWKGSRIVYTD